MRKPIRYANLIQLLEGLGFVCQRIEGSHVNCEHPPTSTLIMLPDLNGKETVWPNSLAAIRRQLDDKEILDRDEFDYWAATTTFSEPPERLKRIGKKARKRIGSSDRAPA
jgi:predicted RNA binding protein YcfA (HicA-like mRNA interferase family)